MSISTTFKINQNLPLAPDYAMLAELSYCLIRKKKPLGWSRGVRTGRYKLEDAAGRQRLRRRFLYSKPRTLPDWLRFLAGWLLQILIAVHVFWIGFLLLGALVFRFTEPAATGFMAYRAMQGTSRLYPLLFLPYKSIPVSTIAAFVRLEDHQFWQHKGLSLIAIQEAMARNTLLKRTVFGGSTITQQLARNLFLHPERTVVRKYFEIHAALMLELVLGKKRIMELYLNTIEFGPGVFGLGRAALYHYGVSFSRLNADQRKRLAVIITNPLRYNVHNFLRDRGMSTRYKALAAY